MKRFMRSAMLFIGALLMTFGMVSESDQSSAQNAPPSAPLAVTVHLLRPAVSIQHMDIRDPFLPDPSVRNDGAVGSGSAANTGTPVVSSVPGSVSPGGAPTTVPALGTLSVPNPDGSLPAGPPMQSATFTLQATLIGNPSLAVFQSGTDTEILRVGEHLGDRLITSIRMGEVGFEDGSRLGISASAVDASSGSSPIVPPPANNLNQSLGNPVVTPTMTPAPGVQGAPGSATPPPVQAPPGSQFSAPYQPYQAPAGGMLQPTPRVSP